MSTAMEQAVACAPVTQRDRITSLVETSFLSGFFRGFRTPVGQMREALRPEGLRISSGRHNHPFIFVLLE